MTLKTETDEADGPEDGAWHKETRELRAVLAAD
jgi:hypothetical protein